MKKEEAVLLMDKFYDATATVEEEQRLADFLRSGDCPPEWETDRKVVLGLMDADAVPLPGGFAERLAALSLNPDGRKKALRPALRRWLVRACGAAALVAVGFGAARLFAPQPVATIYEDTCQSPEEAAEEVRHALLFVSEQFGKGLAEADLPMDEDFEEQE